MRISDWSSDVCSSDLSGGPGLAAISALVRKLALGPKAVQGVLDRVVFNALIGNADAPAKNLWLLFDQGGRRWLAPLYGPMTQSPLPATLGGHPPEPRQGQAATHDATAVDAKLDQ